MKGDSSDVFPCKNSPYSFTSFTLQNNSSKVDAFWDRFWSVGLSNPIPAIESVLTIVKTRVCASI